MKTYLIGYDLNKTGQDYTSLIDKIKSFFPPPYHWHYLDSTWIVKTNSTAVQIRDSLIPYIDKNDEILVAGLTGESAWQGFSTVASEWLKVNIVPS